MLVVVLNMPEHSTFQDMLFPMLFISKYAKSYASIMHISLTYSFVLTKMYPLRLSAHCCALRVPILFKEKSELLSEKNMCGEHAGWPRDIPGTGYMSEKIPMCSDAFASEGHEIIVARLLAHIP